MKINCEICKKELDNPGFILQELTILGYEEKNFCSVKCFLEYVLKKFKRKIKRLLEKIK